MRSKTRGFTLPELTLGMVVAGIVGLAVVGVSAGLSMAYAHSEDYYQCLQTGRSGMMRIQSLLRRTKLVTCASSDALGIWLTDSNDDGRINLDEIRVLFHDPDTQEINLHRICFPEDMDEGTKAALNTELSLHPLTQLSNMLAYMDGAYMPPVTLATHVNTFRVVPATAPPMTRLVKVTLKVTEGDHHLTLRSGVSLRADVTDCVGTSDGQFVLTVQNQYGS